MPAQIMIVEDDGTVTQAMSRLLQQAGYEPVVFNNAASALSFVESNGPAAVVIDIHLPDLNGLVLSRQVREKIGPKTPIIILSGDTAMENINALRYVGATFFVSKPINWKLFIERLMDLMA